MQDQTIRAAISDAVRAAFPEGAGDLEPLPGGRSGAAVFAFDAGGKRWVARHSPHAGVTTRLRIASEHGFAPAIRYANDDTNIAIMEHVTGTPLSAARDPEAMALVTSTVRRLHASAPALFPPNIETAAFYRMVAGEYAKRVGEALPAALTELLEDGIARTAGAELVPCHRDLNPGNVVVDREHGRVWLLDWDSAGEGDPFLDVAQLAVFYAPMPEARAALWTAYLGHAPTSDEARRIATAHVYALTAFSLGFAYMRALAGQPLRAAPVSLPEMFAHLGQHRQDADADLVSASLLAAALAAREEAGRAR